MNSGLHFGYAGNILEVHLSTESITKQPLDARLAQKYLGGTGLASRLLFDELKSGKLTSDPLASENLLIFATGPLTGTLFPQSSRLVVQSLSPLTGIWGEAHSAGFFGPELKFAGFDAIIVRGRASNLSYLAISDSDVQIKDATNLRHELVPQTEEKIRREWKKDARIASIGPAGEKLVRFAAVMNDTSRAAARSGMGAVMGSKNLKAIAVSGSMDLRIPNAEAYSKVARVWHKRMLDNPFTQGRADYGTTILVELMQEIGRLPSYNLQEGVFNGYEKIGGEVIKQRYLVKARADFGCLQRCERYTCVPKGEFAYIGVSPEFETQSAIGSRLGNSNVESVLFGHHLCNELGIDTISCGGTLSWAMECWEKGILTSEDTGGIELPWGDPQLIIRLISMIGNREGVLGDLLAEGSYRAAKRIGRGAEKYVMHSKKQEIAGQDGRAQKSMGLGTATAARGADHLYAFCVLDEIGLEDEIEKWYGEQYLPEIGDRLNPKYKGFMVKTNEDYAAVVESVGVCKYGTMIPPEFFYDDVAEALSITTGISFTSDELREIGERIVNLQRIFNGILGITRKDDSLPDRLTKDPSPRGPAKGYVVELDQMLNDYYDARNWDLATGLPTRRTAERLGLLGEFEYLQSKTTTQM